MGSIGAAHSRKGSYGRSLSWVSSAERLAGYYWCFRAAAGWDRLPRQAITCQPMSRAAGTKPDAHCRLLGRDGRTSSCGPTAVFQTTGCCWLLPASLSTRSSRSSRASEPLFRSMAYLPIRAASSLILTPCRGLPRRCRRCAAGAAGSVSPTDKTALGFGFAGSLIIGMWSANAGVSALFEALTTVYEEHEKRSLVKYYATTFAFTAGESFSYSCCWPCWSYCR